MAAHGLMHMVLHNAWAGDPYPIDTLFMFMANMSWNSAMNVPDTLRYLTDQNADGGYKIPHIIYSDAYYSEMVAYADLILPDTTYLERWDCVSAGPTDLRRRRRRRRQPANRCCRRTAMSGRSKRCFWTWACAWGPAGLDRGRWQRQIPGRLSRLFGQSRAHARHRPLGRLARARWQRPGRGAPNPKQLDRYIENGCFWRHEFTPEQRYFKHANQSYLETAVEMGFIGVGQTSRSAALCRTLAKV